MPVHLVAAAKSLEILKISASLLLMAAALFETPATATAKMGNLEKICFFYNIGPEPSRPVKIQ